MCSPNPWKVSGSNLETNMFDERRVDRGPRVLPGDVVVVQMEGDQLVQGVQRSGGDEVKLVVSDGEELQVPLQSSEGLAVNEGDLVVVQGQGGQAGQTLKVSCCDPGQLVVVHRERVQLVHACRGGMFHLEKSNRSATFKCSLVQL